MSVRFHSQVDIITNSSSVIYTYYQESPEPKLIAAGIQICKTLGIEATEDDFEVRKSLSDEFLDRFFDEPAAYGLELTPEDEERFQEEFSKIQDDTRAAVIKEFDTTYLNPSDGSREAYWERFNALLGDFFKRWNFDPETIEVNYEDDFLQAQVDLELIYLPTGKVLDFGSAFYSYVSQDAAYG